MKIKLTLSKGFVFLLFSFSLIIANNKSFSQLVISNQGSTAQTLISGFIGSGLAISNPVITCPTTAYGTFSGGTIGVSNGVVLTTGTASNLSNNGSQQMSTSHGTTCNDPQLTGLEPLATNDCCILEFDVVPSCSQLTIRFVFGSEEYPEFVGLGFNDAFGFFVTGPNPSGVAYTNKNIAIVTGTTICSIDNVNATTNSGFYVDNATGTGFVFDGHTSAITSTLDVTPCQSYHFKLAIADAGDGGWDSGILIDFLQCTNQLTTSINSTAASCGVSDGTATVTATGNLGALTYTWSPVPGGGQGTATATGLTAGTSYQVIVDDAYSCIDPDTLSVTITGAAGTPNVTNNPLTQMICTGGSTSLVTLTADIVGTIFEWTSTASAGITGAIASGTTTIPVQTLSNSGTSVGTVTYAITPTAAGCIGPVVNYVITVNPFVTPTFAAVPNVCQNASAPVLPTSSTNTPPITGIWSPPVSTATTGTTMYTFTPTAGQCAATATNTITVDVSVPPTFAAISNICQNAVAPVLPASSTNTPPVTGTWLPATINSATVGTTIYTFSPGAGQCPVTATLSVTVDPQIVPTFASIANVCQNSAAPTLPTSSTNMPAITGTWSPAVNTALAGTVTYTFTPTAGVCATIATNTITVDQQVTPLFTSINPICVGSLTPTLTTSSINAPPITGTWSPSVVSNISTGTYTFTPNPSECAIPTTLTVVVDPIPTLMITNPASVCEPLTIDLTDPAITAGSSGGTIAFYSNSTLTVPVASPSSVGASGIYYAAIESTSGCIISMPITVVVNPLPQAYFTPNPQLLNVHNLTSTMENGTVGASSYEWYFMDGAQSNDTDPIHTFPDSLYGDQLIILIAISAEGCNDTTAKIVTIVEELIYYVPNCFTPDGDNFNQTFQPVFTSGFDPYDFTMWIYNRWGELIFETHDASKGWSGTLGENGGLVQDGVYTWKIEFKIIENDKRITETGSVTIVK